MTDPGRVCLHTPGLPYLVGQIGGKIIANGGTHDGTRQIGLPRVVVEALTWRRNPRLAAHKLHQFQHVAWRGRYV